MKIVDWWADLIFGKRIDLVDPKTGTIHKIRIRSKGSNTDDPYGLNG